MKRQALTTTIRELRSLADDLERQCRIQNLKLMVNLDDEDSKFQINIINKTPECSDTWEIELCSEKRHNIHEEKKTKMSKCKNCGYSKECHEEVDMLDDNNEYETFYICPTRQYFEEGDKNDTTI